MIRNPKRDAPEDKLLKRKILKVYSRGDTPDSTLPALRLEPSSFIELANYTDKPLLTWLGENFGIVIEGTLYWTRIEGIENINDFVELYKIAGDLIDLIHGGNLKAIKKVLSYFKIDTLKDLVSAGDIIDYGISHDLIEIKVDGHKISSWEELWEDLASREISEIYVESSLELRDIEKCKKENISTHDECLLKRKFEIDINDFSILKHIPDLLSFDEDVEIYESPEIRDGRVIIGRRGYFEDVYLADLFPKMEGIVNTIKEFKRQYSEGRIKSYDEFLLLKKKQYTMDELRDLVAQGLVRIKYDGNYDKIVEIKYGENIVLIGKSGSEYKLADLLSFKTSRERKMEIVMPLSKSYRDYKSSGRKYYVEWKMLNNVRYSTDRAPKDLNELKKFISLGLVRVDGKRVTDLIIHGKEVFLRLVSGEEVEMYPYVSQRNRFVIEGAINGRLYWIRRFIAEGFTDPDALRLVTTIKKYEPELKKKEEVKIPVRKLSEETGIPEERLVFYLTSEKFKRFGELRNGLFYLHPDIEEFKRNVKVRKDEDYELIVIDGRNVMRGGEEDDNKKGHVEYLLLAIENLKSRGVPEDRIMVIVKNADFNEKRVDNLELLRDLEKKGIVTSISYVHDDMEILRIALEERNALIITNDDFKEFIGGNITEEDIKKRIIKYNFRGKNFHIQKEYLPKLTRFIDKFRNKEETN